MEMSFSMIKARIGETSDSDERRRHSRFPVELEEHKPELKTLTKGTEVPTAVEIAENPRAASARLRAAERIRARRAA